MDPSFASIARMGIPGTQSGWTRSQCNGDEPLNGYRLVVRAIQDQQAPRETVRDHADLRRHTFPAEEEWDIAARRAKHCALG